ncbi:MAG TPA: DUF4491 family protein [Feifaniaceae bacterium]|nr:DUF4491 family protein [Feifaniaceae bacterium]
MYWSGIAIGAMTFLIIGAFHPIVVKCEYRFSCKIWPVFLVCGLACCIASLFVARAVLSAILAVLGFTLLWSIGELKHQEERVQKGWFPENPKRAARAGAKTGSDHPESEAAK